MSFFGDAATDQASKYDDKAGGGFKSALNEPDMTSIAAPVPTHASTGKPADSNPNALRVICDDNAGGNRNNFQPNERLSMTCSAIGGIDVTGVDWVVDDHGKTVLLVSHQGTGVSSTEEDEEGFTITMGTPSTFGVELAFSGFEKNEKQDRHQAQLMYIRTNWTENDKKGFTNSFTFVTADKDHQTQAGEILTQDDNGIASQNGFYDTGSPIAGDSTKTSAASSATGGHTAAQPTSPSAPSKGGHKGLSTGAIAGIAVGGAVVFLGIVGALIWFLVKRKKQKKDPAPYPDETKATAFLHDKDGAHHTDSVIAPYSDDGHNRRSSAPSQQPQPIENEQRALSPPAVRSSGPGVSSSVAHLVEEGMTEADIRRLEEEERHLDAEIERNTKFKSP